jgi:tetratricopeptide (TPR) repeat protein
MHPTPQQVAAFLAGRSDAAENSEIQAHLDICDVCSRERNGTTDEFLTALPQPKIENQELVHADLTEVTCADFLHRFQSAWLSGQPPCIADYLPLENQADSPARSELLKELIKVDLHFRWRTPLATTLAISRYRVEHYLEIHPELKQQGKILLDLIVEEYRVRCCADDQTHPQEYIARFPAQSVELAMSLLRIDTESAAEVHKSQPASPADAWNMEILGKAIIGPVSSTETPAVTNELSEPPATSPDDPFATQAHVPATDANIVPDYAFVDPALPRVDGYEILGELGHGGMGIVYKARQNLLKRVVALKMIRGGEYVESDQLVRFQSEAEAVARLQHPSIVQIFEIGKHEGLPYFALEFVEGGSLDRKLRGTPLDPQVAAEMMHGIAVAIHVAHRAGIIHRDLKPANILLDSQGKPKITDFGLAKRFDAASDQTSVGSVIGTPSYMAPEQAEGKTKELGPAADIYALGATLYEMLTGRAPFKGATVQETLRQVIEQEPVALTVLQPRVPRDLETICLKCLQKDTSKRYTSAEALAEDLRRFQNREPILARRASVWERSLKYTRRKPWVVGAWGSAVAAILFLVAGAGYYLYRENLDLEAELSRRVVLENTRVRAVALVSAAEDAQKRRDWPNVVAAAKESSALVGDEPELADLQDRAGKLRAAAENVLRFSDHRDKAMYHAVLALEESNQRVHRDAAQASAQEALGLFGLTGDGPLSLPRFGDGLFSADTERWLTERCYEMYLTWANVLSAPVTATLAARRSQADAALSLLDRAAHLGLSTQTYHLRRADFLRLRGDVSDAKKEDHRAAALVPSHPVDFFLLGLELSRAGQMDKASVHFKKVVEVQSDHFWASYCLAGSYLRMRPQRMERAHAALTVCVQLQPNFVWPRILRGFVNGELNDFDAAILDFDAAEPLAVDAVAKYGLYVNRAAVRLRQGMNHEQQARGQREGSQTDKAKEQARLAQQCYDLAVPDLDRAITLRPQQPQAYVNLAEVHLQRGRLKEALLQLDKAIALAPSAPLYRTRARLHEKRDAYEAALPDLEKAIQKAQAVNNLAEVGGDQLQRGRLLMRLGRYPGALDAFDKALIAAPNLLVAHQLRGETLLELGRLAEAVAALDRYLMKGPPSALASRARGLSRAKLGNYAGAIEDYSRALEIGRAEGEVDDAMTLSYRGWAYLILEAPKLAFRDFDAAVQQAKSNRADSLAGRGYAQVQMGQWRPAVADAEAALKEGPPLSRTLYNAARIYAQAMLKVQRDATQQTPQGKTLRRQYEVRVLELLRSACEKTPVSQRRAFWNEYVAADPALQPISGTPEFARLRGEFAGPAVGTRTPGQP